MRNSMRTAMATPEHRIPARPSPRAPPPPRSLHMPQPEHTKIKQKKQKTRKQLGKSQIKTSIGMVVLLVFFLIIVFIVFATKEVYTISDSRTMDGEQFSQEF